MYKRVLEVGVRGVRYGMWHTGIQHVTFWQNVLPFPANDGGVIGLTEWEGRVVPVFDAALLLGYRDDAGVQPKLVLWGHQGFVTALTVDELFGFYRISTEAITEELWQANTLLERFWVKGAYQKPETGEIVPVIDHTKIGLFDEELLTQMREYWGEQRKPEITPTTRHLRSKGESSRPHSTTTSPYLIIDSGSEYYALPCERVERILLNLPGVARLPFAPPPVVGSFNYRGAVTTLFSLNDASDSTTAILINLNQTTYGLLIRDIIRMIYANMDDIIVTPGEYGRYSFVWGDKVIPVIQVERLVGISHYEEERCA